MSLTVLVAGGGRVGAALARRLTEADHRVVVVDARPEQVALLATAAPAATVVTADETDPAVLENAGIRAADVVAAVTADDARNLVITSLARFEFAVPRTIARIVDPRHAWMFDEATGVDVAVDQAELITGLIVEEMSLGEVETLVKLRRGAFALVEERLPSDSPAVGRSIAELSLPEACVLVAVLRGDDVLVPRPDLGLQADDEVLAVVHAGAAADLARALGREPPHGGA